MRLPRAADSWTGPASDTGGHRRVGVPTGAGEHLGLPVGAEGR